MSNIIRSSVITSTHTIFTFILTSSFKKYFFLLNLPVGCISVGVAIRIIKFVIDLLPYRSDAMQKTCRYKTFRPGGGEKYIS